MDLATLQEAGDLRHLGSPEVSVLFAVLNRYERGTACIYDRGIKRWAAWCDERGVSLMAAQRTDVETWVREMRDQEGLKPATIRVNLASVQQFYLEALDQGHIDRVPTARVRRPTVIADQKLGISRDQATKLLAAAAAAGNRELALVHLLLLNGLRVSEATGLSLSDLDEVQGQRVARVHGKGNRNRLAPLSPTTVQAIEGHVGLRASGPVFLVPSGRALTRFDAAKIVGQLGRRIGVAIGCHELRHAFVTLSRQAGVSLQDVQESAGHADPKTTAGYDRARHRLENHAAYRLEEFLALPKCRVEEG